jgi:tetratricopeptide (TPR) repeat protein
MRLRHWAPLLLLASVLVHWPSGRAEFTYDDRDFVTANQSVRSLAGALHAFSLPFPPEQPERALYRPLTNLSYALDHAIWGLEAYGYHLTNLALYATVVLLVHRLALAYLPSSGFALASALLFAVHPVHCDAVDSVAGRSEVLGLLWSLLCLLCFLRIAGTAEVRITRLPVLCSALAYALACLSKETGTVLLAVLAVHRLVWSPPPWGAGLSGWLGALRVLTPHALVLVLYAALRTAALGQFTPDAAILREAGFWTRVHTMGAVFWLDLQQLVFPVLLDVDFYYQAVVGIVDSPTPASLLGWAIFGLLLALASRLAWHHFAQPFTGEPTDSSRTRAAALGAFAIFFGTLFPYAHVLDIGALFAERFLFAPSVGFVLLACLLGHRLLGRLRAPLARRAAASVLVGSLALLGALRSEARAREWRDPVALWQAAERHLIGDKRVHTNLAAEHLERGDLDAARQQLEKALAIQPDYLPALGNLGVLQRAEGRLNEATVTYRRILEQQPDNPLVWYNLGLISWRQGRLEEASRHFARSLELNPNFALSIHALEQMRRERGAEGDLQESR